MFNKILPFVVALLLLASLICGVLCGTKWASNAKAIYNDGICADCGGHFHVASSYRVINVGYNYVYECDKCYKTFTSNLLLK